MRADPMNIVMRNGKARMTIDKMMQLIDGVASYNDSVDLEASPEIEYVKVSELARAIAVLNTSGAPIKIWGFDLDSYFRRTGKQRVHCWMSGFVHSDGYGYDPRIQFGQREAPVLCGRQSCFIVWAVRRELARLDAAYPSLEAPILAWLKQRREAARAAGAAAGDAYHWAVLCYALMFVDDIGAASINDLLFDHRGNGVMLARVGVDGAACQQRRAFLHFDAAVGVIKHFGHADSEGTSWHPGERMDFLGATLDLNREALYLSELKRELYASAIVALVVGEIASKVELRVGAEELNSLCHKLLHAASTIILGRAHTFYILRALQAKTSRRWTQGSRSKSSRRAPLVAGAAPRRSARIVPSCLALSLPAAGRTRSARLLFRRVARARLAWRERLWRLVDYRRHLRLLRRPMDR